MIFAIETTKWCVCKLSLLILFPYPIKTLGRKTYALGDRDMDDVSPPGIWPVLCRCMLVIGDGVGR